jgi:hypothetical protein
VGFRRGQRWCEQQRGATDGGKSQQGDKQDVSMRHTRILPVAS